MVKLLLLLGGGYTDIPQVQQTGAHNVKLPAILHSLPLKVLCGCTRPLQDPGIACRISLHMAVAHTAGKCRRRRNNTGGPLLLLCLATAFLFRSPEAILVGVSGRKRIRKIATRWPAAILCRNRRGSDLPALFWHVKMWLQWDASRRPAFSLSECEGIF